MVFLLGSFGSSSDTYAKEMGRLVKKRGWRMVIVNRRGWSYQNIENSIFLHKNETNDFYEVIKHLKEIYESPLYMVGLSAGACHGAKLMGTYGDDLPIDAYVSISNPFNFARLTFTMKNSFMGKIFSKYIASSARKLYTHHLTNPNIIKAIKNQNLNYEKMISDVQEVEYMWDLDKLVTSKFLGYKSIHNYYHHFSCDRLLHSITKPCLFINSLDDPVCIPENIPVDLLY